MATQTERLQSLENQVRGLLSRIIALSPNDIMFSALGEVVVYGCKVTEGDDDEDMIIALEGEAAGDSAHLNPDLADPPTRGFEYPNIASLKDGAFRATTLEATVEDPPATGSGRYDIAYIYVGPAGAGFAVASGTPSSDVKTAFDSDGLDESPYPSISGFDPALPVGASPLARIYVEDDVAGIPDARIADLRRFSDVSYSDMAQYYAGLAEEHANDAAADRAQTGLDAVATAADRVQTGLDVVATAADRVQTGLDVVATAADRVQTGLDVIAAAASASAAAASYDNFDDRYLGPKAADPSLDNDGNTLLVGALYFNTSAPEMRVWTGSSWVNAGAGAGYLPLSGGTMTGALVIQRDDSATPITLRRASNDANGPRARWDKSRGTNASRTIVQSGDVVANLDFAGYDGANFIQCAGIQSQIDGTPGTNDMPGRLVFSTTADGASSPTTRLTISSAGHVTPGADNAQNLGSASAGWKEIFADNGTINTSDARRKTPVEPLTPNELAASIALAREIGSFKFLQSIADKGEEDARIHIGMTVQRAIEIMEAHGLDPMAYSFICYDEWPEEIGEVQTTADDPDAQPRTRQQQRRELQPVTREEIQIIDGKPVLVTVQTEQMVPQFETKPLTRNGEPVMELVSPASAAETEMVECAADDPDAVEIISSGGININEHGITSDDGTIRYFKRVEVRPAQPEEWRQVVHSVPVMEDVTEHFKTVIHPAGDKYSFRVQELLLFIARGMEHRLTLVEAASTHSANSTSR